MLVLKNSLIKTSKGVLIYFKNINNEIPNLKLIGTKWNQKYLGLFFFTKKVFWTPVHFGSILSPNQIITVHDLISLKSSVGIKKKIYSIYYKLLFQRSISIIAISESTKKDIISFFPEINFKKILVIKSGFPTNIVLQNSNIKKEGILVVTNKLPHKNNSILINAFINLKNKGYNYELNIVGNIEKKLIKKIVENNLKFKIYNNMAYEDLINLYSKSSLFISSSLYEGHNLCVSEAILCNCPILISKIDTHIEFYKEFGMFFDPLDIEDLEFKIIKYYDSSTNYNLNNIRNFKHVAQDYVRHFNKF